MKQRRKRKNRKMKSAVMTSVNIKPEGHLIPRDEDLSQSGQENSRDHGKAELITSNPNAAKVYSEDCLVSCNSLQLSELQKKGSPVSGLLNPESAYKSLKADVSGDARLSWSVIPNENMAEQLFKSNLPDRIGSLKNNSILEHDSQNSSLKLDQSDTGKNILNDKESKNTSVEDSCVMVSKNETLSKEQETAPSYQHRTSKRNEINSWAFFSFKLADNQAHSKIDKSGPQTWPEDMPSMLEQRPERMGKSKKVHSDATAELTEYNSDKIAKESGGVLVHLNKDLTDDPPPLSMMENNSIMLHDKTEEFVTEHERKVSIASVEPKEKGKYKRIFKLAPNFDFPLHIPVKKDQKTLNDIHTETEKENISNIEMREKSKHYLHNHKHLLSNYNIVLESSHSDVHKSSNQLAENSVDVSKESALPVQIGASTTLPYEQQIVEFDQIVEINADEMTSPDASTTQPDILCAVIDKRCTDFMAENTENTPQISESEQTVYSQIKSDQDSSFLKLPLSLGFALQLVELFGFPGAALDTLLPDDYIVPLDWATSKKIYLQWKSSVEKKQEKSILKENSLPVDVAALQGSAEDAEEKK